LKKIMSLLLILILLIPAGIIAEEEKPIKVQLNGSYIDFAVPPTMINDRLMVPFRTIAEKIGVTVNFDSEKNQVIATKEERTITFTIDEPSVEIKDKDDVKTITMDAPPTIINDTTLVPLRFIAEATGIQVGWNRYQNTAILIDYSIFVKRIKEESPNLYKTIGLMKLDNNCRSAVTQNYEVAAESKSFGINLKGDSKINADIKQDGKRLSADVTMTNSGLANLYMFIIQQEQCYYADETDYPTPDFDQPINCKLMLDENEAYFKSDFILEMILNNYYYERLDKVNKDGQKNKWIKSENLNFSLADYDKMSVDEKVDSLIKGLSCYRFPEFYDLFDPLYYLRYAQNYYWQNTIYSYNKLDTVTTMLAKLFGDDKLVLTDNADGSTQLSYAIDEKTVNTILLDVISKIEDGKYKEEITKKINQLFEVLHFNITASVSLKEGIILNSVMDGGLKMDNILNPYKMKIGTIDAKFNMTSTSSEIGEVKITDADYPAGLDILDQEQLRN